MYPTKPSTPVKIDSGVYTAYNQVVGQLSDYFKDVYSGGKPKATLMLGKLKDYLTENQNPKAIQQRTIKQDIINLMDGHIEELADEAEQNKYYQEILAGLANAEQFPQTQAVANIIKGIREHIAEQYAAKNKIDNTPKRLDPGKFQNLRIQLGDHAASPEISPAKPIQLEKTDVKKESLEENLEQSSDIKLELPEEGMGQLELPGIENIDAIDVDALNKILTRLQNPNALLSADVAYGPDFELEIMVLMPKEIAFSRIDPTNPLATLDSHTIDWMIKNVNSKVFPMPVYGNDTLTWEAICRYCDISQERFLSLVNSDTPLEAFQLVEQHAVYKATVPLSQLKLQFEVSAGNSFITTGKNIEAEKVMGYSFLYPDRDFQGNPDFGLSDAFSVDESALEIPVQSNEKFLKHPEQANRESEEEAKKHKQEFREEIKKIEEEFEEERRKARQKLEEEDKKHEQKSKEELNKHILSINRNMEKFSHALMPDSGNSPFNPCIPAQANPNFQGQVVSTSEGNYLLLDNVKPSGSRQNFCPTGSGPSPSLPKLSSQGQVVNTPEGSYLLNNSGASTSGQERFEGNFCPTGAGKPPHQSQFFNSPKPSDQIYSQLRESIEYALENTKGQKELAYGKTILKQCTNKPDHEIRAIITQEFKQDKKHGWSEKSFKALVAHKINAEFQFGFKRIRHNCRWNSKKTIPLLVARLESQFPSPDLQPGNRLNV